MKMYTFVIITQIQLMAFMSSFLTHAKQPTMKYQALPSRLIVSLGTRASASIVEATFVSNKGAGSARDVWMFQWHSMQSALCTHTRLAASIKFPCAALSSFCGILLKLYSYIFNTYIWDGVKCQQFCQHHYLNLTSLQRDTSKLCSMSPYIDSDGQTTNDLFGNKHSIIATLCYSRFVSLPFDHVNTRPLFTHSRLREVVDYDNSR